MEKRKKIVLAKPGFDSHDRGIKLIAYVLRDAGMEVVLLGYFQTPEQIVKSAIQEDADIIGLSILSGDVKGIASKLIELIRSNSADTKVIIGGIIPTKCQSELKEMGVHGIFPTGMLLKDILEGVKTL